MLYPQKGVKSKKKKNNNMPVGKQSTNFCGGEEGEEGNGAGGVTPTETKRHCTYIKKGRPSLAFLLLFLLTAKNKFRTLGGNKRGLEDEGALAHIYE